MRKCSMCFARLEQGQQPACVGACPRGALEFGERDQLLKKAKALTSRGNGRYLPRVWGESEWGGTSLLYVSDVDLTPAGWVKPTAGPIPALTDPLIEKTPFIGGGVALLLWGVGTIIQRRMRLMGSGEDHGEGGGTGGEQGSDDHA
jgi:formate dehydrogenase iron-sulfur subunit